MVTLDWALVCQRYRHAVSIAPVSGVSRLTAVMSDLDTITIRQKLWTMQLTRADLESAVSVLNRTAKPVTPVEFAERLRACYTSATECSRIPNVSAIILTDLGLLPANS
jgi:hypothetical protein